MTCRCSWCDTRAHKDFVRGGCSTEDFEESYKAPKAGRGRGKKFCKKSKDRSPCEFTVPIIDHPWFSEKRMEWSYWIIMTCHRCGKQGPWSLHRSKSSPK